MSGQAVASAGGALDGEAAVGADEFLQHHFADHGHQRSTVQLGVWVFLAQEVLFFGGLFCAYAIFRGMYPEIFVQGQRFLNVRMGTINTCILLLSSLTAAWSVRSAQLGDRRGLTIAITLTLLCACAFLGIKYLEYSHKFHEGLLWGGSFAPTTDALQQALGDTPPASRLHLYFSIYFVMTGLHLVHVLAGIGAYSWLLVRTLKGDFSASYYGPVDGVALYWHLVDLVWIFLFPLLYLVR